MEMAGQLRALLSPLSNRHHRLLAILGWSAISMNSAWRIVKKPFPV
jgi:hypothetical protein